MSQPKRKLEIELVPKTSWFNNLRSEFTKEQWDYLRKVVYKRANYQCEICGGKGSKWPVEAHEEFLYHDNGIQELIRVVALCPDCHRCKHPGLAEINYELPLVINHLMKINGISRIEALKQIDDAFELWQQRSQKKWTLDIHKIRDWVEKKVPSQ